MIDSSERMSIIPLNAWLLAFVLGGFGGAAIILAIIYLATQSDRTGYSAILMTSAMAYTVLTVVAWNHATPITEKKFGAVVCWFGAVLCVVMTLINPGGLSLTFFDKYFLPLIALQQLLIGGLFLIPRTSLE